MNQKAQKNRSNVSIVHDILTLNHGHETKPMTRHNKNDITKAAQTVNPAFLEHENLIKQAIEQNPSIMDSGVGVCAYPAGWPA